MEESDGKCYTNMGNKYPLPHMNKAQIRKTSDVMPTTIKCSEEAVEAALEVIARDM